MRDQIVAAVSDLFYRGGTYLIGVDAIVKHLGITRSTLYRHFRGKEGLVVAYLENRDATVRAELEGIVAGRSGKAAVLDVFASLAPKTGSETFRGCSFLIAAAENPGSEAIRAACRAHKLFLQELFGRLVPEGSAHDSVAAQLLVLYEGALAASVLRPEAEPARAAREAAATLMAAGGAPGPEAQG